MKDIRCKNCNRLLMKGTVAVIAIKCPSCKKIFEYKVFSNLSYTNTHDPKETKEHLQNINK